MTKIMTDDDNDHNIEVEGERKGSVELGGDARPGSAPVEESWKMQ